MDLGHPYIPLRLIIGEGDCRVSHEGENAVFVVLKRSQRLRPLVLATLPRFFLPFSPTFLDCDGGLSFSPSIRMTLYSSRNPCCTDRGITPPLSSFVLRILRRRSAMASGHCTRPFSLTPSSSRGGGCHRTHDDMTQS